MEVTFSGSQTISEIDVITMQDNCLSPSTPTELMTFTNYGLTAFDVQYWTGSAWATVSGGSITGNNKVWKKLLFAPLTTTKIRVVANGSPDGWSRLLEVETWTPATGGVHWLVSDQLGTPRMILDETGSLANVTRHDYLPFGEELSIGTSQRTSAQGYGGGDGVRQQFTSKERDVETGLDYSIHRYYSPTQGRFTSPDVPFVDQGEEDPQSWNLYGYVGNNPTNATDPFGLWKKVDCDNGGQCWEAEDGDTWGSFSKATGYRDAGLKAFFDGQTITSGQVFDVGGVEAWTRSLDNGFLGSVYRRRAPEFEPAIGGGLRNVSKSVPSLISQLGRWLGFGKKGAEFAGGVTREAIEAAASDSGSTVQVVTKLTQAPGGDAHCQ